MRLGEQDTCVVPKKKRESTPFQKFMDWYLAGPCRLRKEMYADDAAYQKAVNAGYRRFSRAGKDVFDFAGGDLEKSRAAVLDIGGWLEGKGLSWKLDTIAQWMPDWMADPENFGKEKRRYAKD